MPIIEISEKKGKNTHLRISNDDLLSQCTKQEQIELFWIIFQQYHEELKREILNFWGNE